MSRARSNALTGPTDPRFLSASGLLDIELARPFTMDSTLTGFLKTVYGNGGLMAGPPDLADQLYDLYSNSDVGGGKVPPPDTLRKFVRDLAHAAAGGKFTTPPFLQHTKPPMTLAELETLAGGGGNTRELVHRCGDFIYFCVAPGRAVVRVYANVQFEHIPRVIEWLVNYTKDAGGWGVVDFKVVGPAAVQGRKDAIVIYCKDMPSAKAITDVLTGDSHRGLFNTSVPAMTTQVANGVGVGLGAEPAWQGTGMSGPKMRTDDDQPRHDAQSYDAQSFGTIRCEVIAAAIHNFNNNKDRGGDTFERFTQFVAVAFRGAGLDPARPGN